MSVDDFDRLTEMLNEAQSIRIDPVHSKNYFEVAGYPHYENVASSILAFFFDTNEEHGLKDLWLQSLMECYRASSSCDLHDISEYETVETGVIREDLTSDNKRIDIVIPTNNGVVIAIENKIYADVYNPFAEYNSWLNKAYEQYSDKIEIVLSLRPVSDVSVVSGTDMNGDEYHFVNITYKTLLDAVKGNVGRYMSGANEKWLIYMNEFIRNIESLQEDRMNINREWQLFLEKNTELIGDFNRRIKSDQKAKSDLVDKLSKALQERFNSENTEVSTKAYTYGTQSFASNISLVVDIAKSDNVTIALEPFFVKAGAHLDDDHHIGVFYISFWIRQKASRNSELNWLKDVLDSAGITYAECESSSWGDYLEVKQFDFRDEVDVHELEDYIFDIWKIIVNRI